MIALIVGLGSIGLRHMEILQSIGLDALTVSRRAGGDYPNVTSALSDRNDVDYIVVANETHLHVPTVRAIAKTGFDGLLLVEKPIPGDAAWESDFQSQSRLSVGYNLRFHPCLEALRCWLLEHRPLSIQVRAGQQLKQWRPGRPVGETASAHEQSGGVLRDLSHEIDYLLWLLGPWDRVVAHGGRSGELPIDSDDICQFLLVFDDGVSASVELNYHDTQARRTITVTSATSTIHVDLVACKVETDAASMTYEVARNDTYIAMHRSRLKSEPDRRLCTPREACEVGRVVDAVEHSILKREWISR